MANPIEVTVDGGSATATDATEAFKRIQDSGAKFVSRGDNSGTHQKENEIWLRF